MLTLALVIAVCIGACLGFVAGAAAAVSVYGDDDPLQLEREGAVRDRLHG